jgi:sugar phosphate isomerase/epimerase
MQLALYGSIAWRHPLGFGRVIDWAVEFGWDCVDARGMSLDAPGPLEASINAFGCDMLGPRYIRKSARRELKNKLDDAGKPLLGIYCASSANLPGELGRRRLAVLAQYLELAAELGCPWLRPINNTTATHAADPEQPTMPAEEAYDRTVEGLREVGRRAKDLGIGLLLENNENTVTPDAASLVRLRRDLRDVCHVGIAYDAANAYFQGNDPAEGFSLLASQIDVLHLKNVRRHRDQRWDYVPRGDYSYEWTRLADGDLNWPRMLSLAADHGFDGPLVYEYANPFKGMPPEYWDTLPEPEEAARDEAEYLRKVLAELEQEE